MNDQFTFSPEFWSHFVEHHWERKPLLLKNPFPMLFAKPEDTFEALVQASDQFRNGGDRNVPLRFYIEHGLLRANVGKYLPQSEDRSPAGYAERVTRMLEGRRFGIVGEHFHVYDVRLWMRLRAFLRRLYEFIGLPAQSAYAGVFLGNYESTPSGVHTDDASSFMWIIEGRKRMRLWANDFFRNENIRYSLDYQRFLDDAITLEGEPGDVFYWPSSYWHIGECVDGLSLSVSVTLWVNARPSADVLHYATRMVEERLGTSDHANVYPFHPNRIPQSAETVPQAMERAVDALRKVSRDPGLARAVEVSWLNRVTAFGFTSVPPPLSWKALADDDVVQGDADYPIAWIPADDDEVVCSANGHSFTLPAHPHILKLIERLNSGAAFPVKSLIEEHAGTVQVDDVIFEAAPEEIHTLLEKLYTLRAIRVSASGRSETQTCGTFRF